jgi:hypothetical protein
MRFACLLAAAALIAGCGGASQTASSTARTASTAPAKTPRARTTTRAKKRASRPARFPASLERSFRRTCEANFRGALARTPAQYHAAASFELAQYCTCALRRVEGSVATKQFTHDITAFVSGQAKLPAYMFSAQRVCGAQLQLTLAELTAG